MTVELELNGRRRTILAEPQESLLDVLRRLGVTSVRRGCDTASCNTCSVLVDDRLVPSCAFPAARAAGHRVTTVEGLPAAILDLARELTAEGAEQCGFCGPALLLSVHAMQQELTRPGADEINHYLAGNLCRCSGYAAQLRAIERYLARGGRSGGQAGGGEAGSSAARESEAGEAP
ncbi:MAG: 2Fe-2S iron-sulfur cluster binding domain-containing protein [Candidatus Krumholzibacteriota bacterium]|nr:2Fe-2S iron-sulfur cluster binding domain-containing protein [Candidatus Krumholzibacteriota bacterium]